MFLSLFTDLSSPFLVFDVKDRHRSKLSKLSVCCPVNRSESVLGLSCFFHGFCAALCEVTLHAEAEATVINC